MKIKIFCCIACLSSVCIAATIPDLPEGFTGLTYWLDPTCNEQFKDSFKEAQQMALIAAGRLFDGNDELIGQYYEDIFMIKRQTTNVPGGNDPLYIAQSEVSDLLESIAHASPVSNRELATTRIYCDNDGRPGGKNQRWQLVPDIPGDKKPNSKRPEGGGQEWQDVVNHVRADNEWRRCPNLKGQQALTVGGNDKYQAGTWPGEIEPRYFCDRQVGKSNSFQTLQDVRNCIPNTDFSNLKGGISTGFSTLTSMVILHELTHSFLKVDHVYGWVGMQKLSHDKAIMNADSYAYFGLLALLLNLKWRLADKVSGQLVDNLVYDDTIQVWEDLPPLTEPIPVSKSTSTIGTILKNNTGPA